MNAVQEHINLGMLSEGTYTGIAECRWSLRWPLASNQEPDDESRIIRRDVDGFKGRRCPNNPTSILERYIYGVRG
jgi:hypothetical protein